MTIELISNSDITKKKQKIKMKKSKKNQELINVPNNKFDWFIDFLAVAGGGLLFTAGAVASADMATAFCYFVILFLLLWIHFRNRKILVLNENDLIITYKYSKLFPKKIRISYDDVDRILFKMSGGIGSDCVMQVFFKNAKSKKIRFTSFDGLYWDEFIPFMNEKGIRVKFS